MVPVKQRPSNRTGPRFNSDSSTSRAVEQAESLIDEVMRSLTASCADERETLERRWGKGDDNSTEDLQISLQRYRSVFDRLLSV